MVMRDKRFRKVVTNDIAADSDMYVLKPEQLDREGISIIARHAAKCHAKITYVELRRVGAVNYDIWRCGSAWCQHPELRLARNRTVQNAVTGRQRNETDQLAAVASAAAAVSVTGAQEMLVGMRLRPPDSKLMHWHRKEVNNMVIEVADDYMDLNAEKVKANAKPEDRLPDGRVAVALAGDGSYGIRSRKNSTHNSEQVNYGILEQVLKLPVALSTTATGCEQCLMYWRGLGPEPPAKHTRFCQVFKSRYLGAKTQLESGGAVGANTQVQERGLVMVRFGGDRDNASKNAIQQNSPQVIDIENCVNHHLNNWETAMNKLVDADPRLNGSQMRTWIKVWRGKISAAIQCNIRQPRKIHASIMAVLSHHTSGTTHCDCDASWCNYKKHEAAGEDEAMHNYTPKSGYLELDGGLDGALYAKIQAVFTTRFDYKTCVALQNNFRNNAVEGIWATAAKYNGGKRTNTQGAGSNGNAAAGSASVAQRSDPELWKEKVFEKNGLPAMTAVHTKVLEQKMAQQKRVSRRAAEPKNKLKRAIKKGRVWAASDVVAAAASYTQDSAEPDGSTPASAVAGPVVAAAAPKVAKRLCSNCRQGYHFVRECKAPRAPRRPPATSLPDVSELAYEYLGEEAYHAS
jgi:hypothetical protein